MAKHTTQKAAPRGKTTTRERRARRAEKTTVVELDLNRIAREIGATVR